MGKTNYTIAQKAQARQLFLEGLSIYEVFRTLKARDGFETLSKNTIEAWSKRGDWKLAREEVHRTVLKLTEEKAAAIISEELADIQTVKDKLLEKLKNNEAKCGSVEGLSYAIMAAAEKRVNLSGAKDRLRPKVVNKGKVIETEITGTFRQRIETASQEIN